MIQELITIVLPHIPDPEFIPGTGSELTPQDVMAALGGIKDNRASRCIHIKFLGDKDVQSLVIDLQKDITQTRKKWSNVRGHRPGLILDLAWLAVNEYLTPKICPICSGRKTFKQGNLIIDCQACVDGKIKRNGQQNALDIEDKDWPHWEQLYRQSVMTLYNWEGSAIGDIAENIT